MKKTLRADVSEYAAQLKKVLKPGATVYTVLRSRSRSGMSRKLDLFAIVKGEPRRLTYWAAQVLGWRYDTKAEALHVDGCGMDMGFHTVHTLASVLWPKRRAESGTAGGVALRHEWL